MLRPFFFFPTLWLLCLAVAGKAPNPEFLASAVVLSAAFAPPPLLLFEKINKNQPFPFLFLLMRKKRLTGCLRHLN
jgi:hypothetical protein